MNSTMIFTSARDFIELAGLFLVLLPVFMVSVLAIMTYYNKR